MMLLQKLYAQFQPSRAFEVLAVVEQKRKIPVSTVELASVPRRPKRGSSTQNAPTTAPGTPRQAIIALLRYVMYVELSPKFAPRRASR